MTDFLHRGQREGRGLRALNRILFLRGGGSNKLMWASIDTGRSEAHYDGSHDAASCVIQFKNELVDITSMPMIELAGCAAHSHKEAMGRHREVFRSWRVPCLGLTVVGKLDISGSLYESDMMYIMPSQYVTL